ncbi:PIG-L deacetylase family protein [Shewanella sediminis]|nr:PIG-L deacetylase family protein [Shewanella sediminis]
MEPVEEMAGDLSVVVIFAHPDDETWISGTLAKLSDHGVKVFPVYATSGDAGSDHSGQGLSGSELALIREQEAIAASQILGLQSPIFLRLPDGKLNKYSEEIIKQLNSILEQEKPTAILTFVEGGITDNRDHKTLNRLVSAHFNRLAGYFGVSYYRAESLAKSANKFGFDYKVAMPIEDAGVTIRVDVSSYKTKRVKAMASHKTQFPSIMIKAYTDYAESVPLEEIITINGGSCSVLIRLLE